MPVIPRFKVPASASPRPASNSDDTGREPEKSPSSGSVAIRREPQDPGRQTWLPDFTFRTLVYACAVSLLAIVGLIVFELFRESHLSLHKFGFKFLTTSAWNPVTGNFGALPFIYGTLVSSFLALLIAIPLSLGTALFLTEICPAALRRLLGLTVELLAAIPSVIYGLWGIFVLAPVLRNYVEPFLQNYFGWTGLFEGPPYGIGMLAAGLILAIMILPIIASVTREVIMAVPRQQREAVLALGATKWEVLRTGVLRNARTGIVGGIILGLGRALGETMAVTMMIGNRPEISKSLLAPGHSLASVIAAEFSEAVDNTHLSSLVEMALVLFFITLVVNGLARLLVWSTTRGMSARNIA